MIDVRKASDSKSEAPQSDVLWLNKRVAIILFPALGDITIFLRLAQSLASAGSLVSVYSDGLSPAADLFDWCAVKSVSQLRIDDIAQRHDLVFGDVLSKPIRDFEASGSRLTQIDNFVAVAAKTFPARATWPSIPEWVSRVVADSPHRAFCSARQHGDTMVGWVDGYVRDVLRLPVGHALPRVSRPAGWTPDHDAERRVLIFPTTPNPKKNFHLAGFKRLRDKLVKNGWKVEIVCMSHERLAVEKVFDSQSVLTFPDIRALILHIMQSRAVISNDSGGGHLASMLGLPTFTITKKREDFVWRPGFNDQGHVISPVMTFKWFTGRIWRPFVPLDKIVRALSHLPESHR